MTEYDKVKRKQNRHLERKNKQHVRCIKMRIDKRSIETISYEFEKKESTHFGHLFIYQMD